MKTKVTKVLTSIMTSIMKLFKHANKIYWQFSMDHPVWLGFFEGLVVVSLISAFDYPYWLGIFLGAIFILALSVLSFSKKSVDDYKKELLN